ncbi:hypothetical protein [Chromobacterium sp. LK1]|uniref:hypothetical protein n=1 Tax=Chromobacterium sp. LK1 TaxID=1628193 RepID=UPI000653D97D|nr:hypothetical protein [Chromobacterium sp. LK1]
MSASALLQTLIREHDNDAHAAAASLRQLAATAAELDAEQLASLSWLINHVLGETLGDWLAAWGLQRQLPSAAPSAKQLRNQAVAAGEAGADQEARELGRCLAVALAVPPPAAELAIALAALQHLAPSLASGAAYQRLRVLLPMTAATEAGAADAMLAAALSNVLSGLLERDLSVLAADEADALREGAALARQLWARAGGWLQQERACYLQALVANGLREWEAARIWAWQGLDLITTHGEEAVDQAFLLLEQVKACGRLEQHEAAEQAWAQARRLAAAFEDAELKAWFEQRAAALAPA